MIIFDRIRHAVSNTPIIFEDHKVEITISCGVSIFAPPDDRKYGQTLLARADGALYEAKENGRNRTVVTSR